MALTKKAIVDVIAGYNLLVPQHVIESIAVEILALGDEGSLPGATQQFIRQYAAAYKQAFGFYPAVNGANQGAAKSIVKAVGLKDAVALAGTYLNMPDPYFRNRSHDLVTLAGSLNKVKMQHETGRTVTQTEVRTDDRRQANTNIAREYLESMGGEGDGEKGVL